MTAALSGAGFECVVRYSRRRTLALYVHRDGRVELRAPAGYPVAELERFLSEREGWVQARLAELADRPAPRRYLDGEPQPFLGRDYPLQRLDARPYGVWLAGGRLLVRCRGVDEVPGRLKDWYRRQARKVFSERLQHCDWMLRKLAVPTPELRVRAMRSRWGSCSSRGSITLNLELVKYPLELIDYVLVHELCHLREFNHGPGLYALMDRFLPDWRDRRRALREQARSMAVD